MHHNGKAAKSASRSKTTSCQAKENMRDLRVLHRWRWFPAILKLYRTLKRNVPRNAGGPPAAATLPVQLVQLAHYARHSDLYTRLLSKPGNVPPIQATGGTNTVLFDSPLQQSSTRWSHPYSRSMLLTMWIGGGRTCTKSAPSDSYR